MNLYKRIYTPKDMTMHGPRNNGFMDHYTQKY